MNNAGLIARITGIRPHSNADTLSVGLVNYNEVIIKNDTYKEGDLVLYIPVDCQIGENFAIANKLVKSHGGYLDDNKRNITALRLRGERSNGLVLPLSSLEGLMKDINSLKDGDDISELKGEIIVQKYIPIERKKQNEPRQQQTKKLKPEEKTLYPFFKEHLSTSHLTRNLHKFKIGDKVNVTLKMHGCFTSDTKVRKWNESRAVKMSEVKIGDVLVGYDEKNKKYIPSKVLNVFKNGKTADWMEIHITRNGFQGGEKFQKIKCTPNHRFYVDGEYVEASNLKIGQKMKTAKDTIILTDIQKSVLLGLALGDGSITNREFVTKVEFSHKKEHEELLDYEINSLGNIANTKKQTKISGFGTKMICAQSKELLSIKNFIDSIFIDRHSFIKEELIRNLNEIVLAFLYLADGSLTHSDKQEDRANIAICSFDDENSKILVDSINEKFNLNAVLYKDPKGYNRCRFNKDCAKKLFNIIEKYIPICCRYKLPKDYEFSVESPISLYSEGEFGYLDIENEITHIGNPNLKRAEKYDLETETHNYIVGNSHVHNSSQRCSNTLILRRKKENWIQKLISKLMKKKPKYDKTYELTTGTRRVILKDFSQKQFYENNNFRKKWHDFFIGKLDEGMTVYFEVVGYTEKGSPIMGRHSAEKIQDKEIRKKYGKAIVYSYGCADGESDIYVYRITQTSEEGFIKEFSDVEIFEKCKEWGCKQVPLLDSFIYSGEGDIKRIINLGNAECTLFPEHPKEGVVARIDSTENQFDVYKYKSFVFCELEGIAKNSGMIDMEEAESLETQEV